MAGGPVPVRRPGVGDHCYRKPVLTSQFYQVQLCQMFNHLVTNQEAAKRLCFYRITDVVCEVWLPPILPPFFPNDQTVSSLQDELKDELLS